MTRPFPQGGPELHHRWLSPGDPDAPPLVLLHGFTGDSRSWEDFAAAWDALGRAPDRPAGRLPGLLALDLIGHGSSLAPPDDAPYSVPAGAGQVLATVAGLGIRTFHALGYSMGGRVALHAALVAPEVFASLSLIGASPGLSDQAERRAREAADRAMASEILVAGLPGFVDRWMAQPLFASQARLGPERLAIERRRRLEQSPTGMALSLRMMGTGSMTPLWAELPRLKPRLMVMAGEEDAKFVAIGEAVAALVPRSRLEIIPQSGHAAHLEAPVEVARRVMAFVLACRFPDPTMEIDR